MKKIILTLLIASSLFFACEDIDTANVSKVTNYPVIVFEPTVAVPLGGTYVPDGISTEGGVEIPTTITGAENVNTNQVGIYLVNYTSATNADGFSANATQTVVVFNPDIVGTDVTGKIRDKNNNTRTGVITLVEGTKSIFLSSDFGFAGTFPVYFQMDGDVISEIPQPYINDVTSVELGYDPVALQFTTLIKPQGFAYTFEYY